MAIAPSNYTRYLDFWKDFRTVQPKTKFLYTVQISFRGADNKGSQELENATFALKQTTRPNINIVYEDANFYNFRTKIATRADYGTMSITFYDDSENLGHEIMDEYLASVSPISQLPKGNADNLDSIGDEASSIGALTANQHGPIHDIRVIQHYRGRRTIYDFLNPKVTNMAPDELDMTQSDISTIAMTFTYDSVNIIHA